MKPSERIKEKIDEAYGWARGNDQEKIERLIATIIDYLDEVYEKDHPTP